MGNLKRLAALAAVLLVAVACDPSGPGPSPEAAATPSPTASSPSASASPASGRGGADPTPSEATRGTGHGGHTYLVWSPGGMPAGAASALRRLPAVTVATTVVAGQSWIDNASRGRIPPPGYAFPLEMAYVSPRPYERLIVDGAAPAVGRSLRGLRPGRLLLADAEARLRGAGTGLGLDLEGRHFVTGGTVPEWATSGYEALATGPPPAGWGVSYLLVRSRQRAPLRPAVRALLGSGAQFRIRRQGETPFLRYADAVTPQLDFKLRFGEFPARPLPDGRIDIAPAWHRSHITSGKLPIVGTATCNRSFFPLIKAALRKVEAAGLGHLIKPSGFAGCYSARFIGSDPHGRLSSHAWGAAVDLNAPDNPMGSTPTMDPRIVGLMKSAGLNWGGDWLVPDGMHFEWAAPHSAAGPPGK